jgi:hypothetical protein
MGPRKVPPHQPDATPTRKEVWKGAHIRLRELEADEEDIVDRVTV